MWKKILPLTSNEYIEKRMKEYDHLSYGQITSGCGGGYLILVTDKNIPGGLKIKIRR